MDGALEEGGGERIDTVVLGSPMGDVAAPAITPLESSTTLRDADSFSDTAPCPLGLKTFPKFGARPDGLPMSTRPPVLRELYTVSEDSVFSVDDLGIR